MTRFRVISFFIKNFRKNFNVIDGLNEKQEEEQIKFIATEEVETILVCA